jgi:YrbI family 3-deoxy-D-manno-octulosonate 8-phosphate phosphatase
MTDKFEKIRLIVSDFDGVMTDNKVIVNEEGVESVFCNRSDGMGIKLLKEKGVDLVVLSKEVNKVVETRCKKLGIEVYHGIDNKIKLFRKVVKEKKASIDEVCYVGNEINDFECMQEAGISVAPSDSHESILNIADFVTKARGGEGVIREISDLILQ